MHPVFRKLGWLLYAAFFGASYAGLERLAWVLLLAGMAYHWRFWRAAIPLWTLCAVVGWHLGGRKH